MKIFSQVGLALIAMSCCNYVQAQHSKTTVHKQKDSIKTQYLPDITIVGSKSTSDINLLPDVVGTSIYAGKKSSLIVMDNVNGNVVTNTMRQVMAKVPGIHVWESDGSGIQIGIAARGLSPNRSWEFNVRQNGYDIAADPFGYPEAYYNPQLQSVQRIEVLRGQAALQYGPQFGGMVNYILRNGSDIEKPFQFETQQTVGSNGLINTYNAIGGKTGKVHYYAFYDHRNADGWRENSRYYQNAAYGTITYQVNNKLSLTAEMTYSHMRSQQPGGLTDAQFQQNHRQSFRNRNWFDVPWVTGAIIANYAISAKARINTKLFTTIGDRNSLGFLRAINIADTVNAATNQYNNRTVDIDRYRNYGMETRFISDVNLFKIPATFSAGIRAFTGTTYRYRNGVGTVGNNYDLSLINGTWPVDIEYKSNNYAAFAETMLKISNRLLVVPGIRYEFVEAIVGGRNGFNANGSEIKLQDQQRGRGFLLAGLGIEYKTSARSNIYANFTQAYRPIQFADLQAPPTTDVIDPNLRDAKGFNADLGFRGKIQDFLFVDASLFYLQYNNRVGTISQQREDGSFYNLRTNVGNSSSYGIEALTEISLVRMLSKVNNPFEINVFASYSYTRARYGNFKVITRSGNTLVESNLRNKHVENAPEHILRMGVTASYKNLSFTVQNSSVTDAFSDANNTVIPTANGQNGLIPGYQIMDLHVSYRHSAKWNIKLGLNNAGNTAYFTRRAGGYPGPGLMPADGRTFFLSFGTKI